MRPILLGPQSSALEQLSLANCDYGYSKLAKHSWLVGCCEKKVFTEKEKLRIRRNFCF